MLLVVLNKTNRVQNVTSFILNASQCLKGSNSSFSICVFKLVNGMQYLLSVTIYSK